MASILVCDDDRSLCTLLEITLRKEGHRVETVSNRDAAQQKIDQNLFDVIVSDIRMPRTEDGLSVLQHARQNSPESAVIMVTAVGELESAIQAVRLGAFDYILKEPNLVQKVRVSISRALESVTLRRQNSALKRDAAVRNSLDNIIGTSAPVEKLKNTIRTVASTGSTVVIHGESGTGKELVARAVHSCSQRAAETFLSVNCGAMPENLLESELFGYVKGAFTGANQNRAGLFEAAHSGTVFLDEIGEMTLAMQVKLLRVLQERTIRPVGGTQEIGVDVRVIAATHRNLEEMVQAGTFREDLYYRLAVIPIHVPPLRDRKEDIPLLATHFLKKYARTTGKSIQRISAAAMDRLTSYEWPGNVRQLENVIERSVTMELGEELQVELPLERRRAMAAAANGNGSALVSRVDAIPEEGIDLERHIASIERSMVQAALRQSGGVQTKAAEMLKLSYRSFRHLLKKYDI